MSLKEKKERLKEIYRGFESEVADYHSQGICKPGCAFCCTEVGNVDVITLEGMIIYDRINSLPKKQKAKIKKKLEKNRREKESRDIARCPFLKEDDTCLIYDIRPFSCRSLYSVAKCEGKGPTVHKQAAEISKGTVKAMQEMDENGYSGHISFILHLLGKHDFRKLYLTGGFDPVGIMDYGKTHGIAINKFISRK